ncbi:MAG: hypothetical protein MJE68_00370 [Proteobacteria bacterium]|nr:hypothetical protein [Pseudomonadota bacterium]
MTPSDLGRMKNEIKMHATRNQMPFLKKLPLKSLPSDGIITPPTCMTLEA